jgi:hypothetical protein
MIVPLLCAASGLLFYRRQEAQKASLMPFPLLAILVVLAALVVVLLLYFAV